MLSEAPWYVNNVTWAMARLQSSNCVTRNYGNYPYGNYVDNALIGKVITLNT